MESIQRGSCLLVMPRHFYSFAKVLGRTLEELGYEVTQANEDYPENIVGKLLAKLDLPLARWWTRRVIRHRFLEGRRWNLIVIIKGRGVSAELVDDMRRTGARVVGYHFDALAYDRATRRWGDAVDRVTTFDYRDAEAEGWPVVELFATHPPARQAGQIRYRLSAILRNHSQRLAYVDRVLGMLGNENSFVYIFERGFLSLALNALRNPACYWRWRRHIHMKPLPYEDYVEVLGGSDFTLDYAHPKQSGATMRCFEALAMGVKLITNNRHILRSEHFRADNVVVCAADANIEELGREVRRLEGSRPKPFQRTPESFLREVIGEGGLG